MRNTGETVTVQALVLNCDHADVMNVLSADDTPRNGK
jgi:hypothetical protein